LVTLLLELGELLLLTVLLALDTSGALTTLPELDAPLLPAELAGIITSGAADDAAVYAIRYAPLAAEVVAHTRIKYMRATESSRVPLGTSPDKNAGSPVAAPLSEYIWRKMFPNTTGLKCIYCVFAVAANRNHCSPPAARFPSAHILTVNSITPGGAKTLLLALITLSALPTLLLPDSAGIELLSPEALELSPLLDIPDRLLTDELPPFDALPTLDTLLALDILPDASGSPLHAANRTKARIAKIRQTEIPIGMICLFIKQ
jgi:hypothetical protein